MIASGNRPAKWLLGGLIAVGAIIFVLQTSPEERSGKIGPQLVGDGRYYYLVLRSLALDHDFDYANDYARFGNWYYLGKTKIGRPANVFGIGPAIAWLPFFGLAHAVALVREGLGAGMVANGMGRLEIAMTLGGTYVYGALAIWLAFLLARRWFSPWASLVAVSCAWLGGPLVFYQIWECSYAHAIEACAATGLVLAWVSWRHALDPKRWIALGALAGALCLVRPQAAVFALLPLGGAIREILRQRRVAQGLSLRALEGPLLATTTMAIVFFPQALMWKSVYGQWLLVPQGSGFLRYGESLWRETLFSARNGLVWTSPIWGIGITGAFVFVRKERWLGLGLVTIFFLTAFVNGAAWDWWGGGSYSGRRYSAVLPIIVLGLATILSWIEQRKPWLQVVSALPLAALLFLQLGFLHLYLGYRTDKTRKTRWVQTTSTTWGRLLGPACRGVIAKIGNPFSLPASLPFAIRYGVAPARYELVVGPYLLDERVPTTNPRRVGKRVEAIWLAASAYTVREGLLLVPLNRTGRLHVRVEGTGDGFMRWNGETLGHGPLPFVSDVSADRVRRGINEVEVPPAVSLVQLEEREEWPPVWSLEGAP